jgi:hypothetical protein
MSPKILRRCSICGNFHASYLVAEPDGGESYYCYNCWKARFGPKPEPEPSLTIGTAEEGKGEKGAGLIAQAVRPETSAHKKEDA